MIQLVDVGYLQANEWNPNVMQDTEYQALKQDMHVHGVDGVDAVLVSPYKVFHSSKDDDMKSYFVIVDGEHRWRAAVELGWKEIRCEIQDITEDEAKALCYRRNRERGTIDPFKEALLFKTELPKLTQAKIAGKYGINQATVSQRLSLLKLDPEVVEKLKDIPRGILSVSHLEPLATLDPKDQKIVFKDAIITPLKSWSRPPSVKEIESHVSRVKEERIEEAAIAKALETAKYPKCPHCKSAPKSIYHKGLPWVTCGRCWRDWNLKTGKGPFEDERSQQKDLDGKTKPIPSKTIRCAHTISEMEKAFVDRIKEVIPALQISSIKVSGKLDGAAFSFDLSSYSKTLSVSWHRGELYRGFRAEEHEYKSSEKSAVDAFSPEHVADVKELIENAFQGKLGVEFFRLKKAKTAAEKIHELHSERVHEASS